MFQRIVCSMILGLLCHLSYAQDIAIVGEQEETVQLNQTRPTLKSITLIDIKLSKTAQHTLYQRVQKLLRSNIKRNTRHTATAALPSHKQLGMNRVPVLDQGKHGTCVTFAVTAAIDAALKKGNYISQLCLLQLGRHFELLNGEMSGWQGAYPYLIFKRIDHYGIISLQQQQQYGCGGINEYPYDETPQIEMTLEEYEQYHEPLNVHWTSLFNKSSQIIANDAQSDDLLNKTKAALNSGHRVVIGTLLPRSDLGAMGAVGWHHLFYDTWVLTEEIAQELQYSTHVSGHALIMTGYDDTARAMDNTGQIHYGLFTLRNSWGTSVGDSGEFYMSYDYFKVLVHEAYQLESNQPRISR